MVSIHALPCLSSLSKLPAQLMEISTSSLPPAPAACPLPESFSRSIRWTVERETEIFLSAPNLPSNIRSVISGRRRHRRWCCCFGRRDGNNGIVSRPILSGKMRMKRGVEVNDLSRWGHFFCSFAYLSHRPIGGGG